MTIEEIQKRLDELREKWKVAVGADRIILEKRGKMLKIALEKKLGKTPQQKIV
jgi:hypothetical protein